MKKVCAFVPVLIFLSACDVWNVQPQPFPYQTPQPSLTPSIWTPTPIVILSTPLTFPTLTVTQNGMTVSPVVTLETAAARFTATTASTPKKTIQVEILGCDTGIDITHGMGEVTNAYATVKNNGETDLPNTCALLRAVDEGREHPDKKKCVDNLPAHHQATLKLTVDSTYKVDTAIQIDVTSNGAILLRIDQPSCRDISLFGGEPVDVGIIKPIEP